MITLAAKSSSGGTYQVTFAFDGQKLSTRCTCKAGIMGALCKHRIALVVGDTTMLAKQDELADLQKVTDWAKQAGILDTCNSLVEAEREVARAQEKVRKLKKILLEKIA